MKYVLIAGVIALAGIAAALYFLSGSDESKNAIDTSTTPISVGTNTQTAPSANVNPFNALAGIRKTKAPWPPEYANLSDRLEPLKLTALTQEELAFHIHQHLDVFANGKLVPGGVPGLIGVNDDSYITELHTHAEDGIIHVESATERDYTLGEFFGEWGVYLDSKCVGAYCGGVTVYVNGKKDSGPPQDLVLKEHQQITVVAGKPPAEIPAKYPSNGP